MRFPLLCASAALATSLALSACSGGGGPASIPGASQPVAPMSHRAGNLVPIGLHEDDGNYGGACPGSGSSYLYCYYITAGTSFSQEWEEEYPSGGEEPGTWHWRKSHIYNAQTAVKTNQIRNNGWSPEPGNPSTQTVTVSSLVPATNGSVGYYLNLSVCSNNSPNGRGYCDSGYQIGIVVLGSGS